MISSENPSGAETLTSERHSYQHDASNFAAQSPASLNFDPDAPITSEVAAASTLPAQNGTSEDTFAQAPAEFNLLKELQKATSEPDGSEAVSKGELAVVLEGFARVLRGDSGNHELAIADKTAENSQLKELLMEAQETIIGLLNDRVFDRAKIARLEAETRLMPDLQSQASRAMGLAMRSEDVQKELTYVRTEVERLRTSYIKSEQGFFSRLFGRQ